MTTQPNSTNQPNPNPNYSQQTQVHAKLDQLGQAALEAIFKEANHLTPAQQEIVNKAETLDRNDPAGDGLFDQFKETVPNGDTSEVAIVLLTHMSLSEKRRTAVKEYTTYRQMAISLGVIQP